MQIVNHALTFTVGDEQAPGFGIEDDHANRGYIDQRFQVGLSSFYGFEFASVGDCVCRMRGEALDDAFVSRRELFPGFGFGQVYVADMDAVTTDGHAQERSHRRMSIGQPDRPGMAGNVRDPQWALDFVQVAQQSLAFWCGLDTMKFIRGASRYEYAFDFA